MRIHSKIKCPYCKTEQPRALETDDLLDKFEVTFCDEELGGCGKLFVFKTHLQLSTSVLALESEVEKKINLRLERARLNILRMRDGRATLLCETCGEEVNRDKSRGAFSYTDGSTYCSQDCARKR